MISTLVRKVRTVVDTVHDFYREPLASFQALEKGLEDRRRPVPPELVDRVMTAYEAAKRDQQSAGSQYQANGEWTTLIEAKLKAFRDRGSMGEVLGSLFRHQDAFVGLSDYATPPYLKPRRRLMTRALFVNSMLHDYRVWSELTVALMGGQGILAEIGGGWGDVGFFALSFPGVHYVDIDLPEILLLASYWLCSTLPGRKVVLYGEQNSKTVLANIEQYDAILFPNFCLPHLPKDSVDIFLNTHSLSEMRPETIQEYLGHIGRTCRRYFLHENSDKPYHTLGHTEIPASSFSIEGFRLLNKAMSPWRAGGGRYREFVYERTAA